MASAQQEAEHRVQAALVDVRERVQAAVAAALGEKDAELRQLEQELRQQLEQQIEQAQSKLEASRRCCTRLPLAGWPVD